MTPRVRQHTQGVLLALITLGLFVTSLRAQSVELNPNEVINGIESASMDQFHQRFDIVLGSSANQSARGITITVPSELTVLSNSVTTTTNAAALTSFFVGSPTTSTLVFGLTGTASNATVSIEFDLKTPTSFTGISNGSRVDTVYVLDFSSGVGAQQTVRVSKLQNTRMQQFEFVAPDSSIGDTTTLGGRFFDLQFPTALPDLSHTGISGLSASQGVSDGQSDVLYTFYLSTDSTLITRPSTLAPVKHFSLGADRTPIAGQRQRPRQLDATFIREDFVSTFSSTPADSVNGVISLEETSDNTVYYVYVLADPAPDRFPTARLGNGGGAKLGFDNSRLGTLTGQAFLARSGPLLVNHPPEFVLVGWDYDDDGGDQFTNTGVIQVPSDIIGMGVGNGNRKDNRNVIIDTGSFVDRGEALSTLNNGNTPDPITSLDLLFLAEDVDNPNSFEMRVFVSQQSGLTESNYVGAGLDSLDGATMVSGSDTLSINNRTFPFLAFTRNTTTQLVTNFVEEGQYFVYFGATDGDDEHRIIRQVQDDPFDSSPSFTTVTVTHSPNLTPDTFTLNDRTNPNDGDLDVITGIDVSQMQSDPDGKDLRPGPATRFVTISWGETGLAGDVDVDDNAQIDFYYSTRFDFRDASKSVGYTSGNSDGADLLAAIADGSNDTHTIVTGVDEDPDGLFDNQYSWDVWNYVSPAGEGATIPITDTRYYVYAIITGGNTSRLVSFTEASGAGSPSAVSFLHPPYIRGIQPTQDVQVSVEDPVVVAWEAVDVDNAGGHGGAVPGRGLAAPDGSASSPNIRILLTSSDFGEVTTWASLTSPTEINRMWLANSPDGSLGSEIELNESVDTSFVIVANRLRNNLGTGSSSGTLELQTNGQFGQSYWVYLAIDAGRPGTGGLPMTGDQPTNLSGVSPAVRAPGRITFTGVVPASPPTSARFIVPRKLFVVEDDTLRIPITPDDGDASGRQIDVVDIFLSLDSALFEPLDTDGSTTGIQPFTLGSNASLTGSNVQQVAREINGVSSFEFIYTDQTSGLTFFDGVQTLAFVNFKARPLSGGAAVLTTISIDSQDPRRTKMIDQFGTDIHASVPPPIEVRILPRGAVRGNVLLQGRSSSADTITFYLREVGSFDQITDPFFEENDLIPEVTGVQVQTTGVNGEFELNSLPSGRLILVAKMDRHLAGHDTLDLRPGQSIWGFQPTIDGSGVDRGFLLSGDAAGFNDSTGTSLPDNFVDSQDLNAINAALFTQTGDTDYNGLADLNRDGIVNATDKDFTAVNLTDNTNATGGIRPVLPTFKRADLADANATAKVHLSSDPSSGIQVGDTFDVTIEVEDAVAVRTYEYHLHYDPTVLAAVDMVSPGTILDGYRTDISGKILEGEVGIVNSVLGRTEVGGSGSGTLGTIRLQAIKGAPHTTVQVANVMLIDVDQGRSTPKIGGDIVLAIEGGAKAYHDANGNEILGLILADEDPTVDFNDFIAFTQAFGLTSSDLAFDTRADLNLDGRVDFADFLLFTMNYGRVAVDAPSSGVAKPSVQPGTPASSKGIKIGLEETEVTEERVVLTVQMFGADAMQAWRMELNHSAEDFEFVGARLPDRNLLEKGGAQAPLLLVKQAGAGRTILASAIAGDGQAVSGDGRVVEAIYKIRGNPTRGVFRVEEGRVFDGTRESPNPLATEQEVYISGPSQSFLLTPLMNLFNSISLP